MALSGDVSSDIIWSTAIDPTFWSCKRIKEDICTHAEFYKCASGFMQVQGPSVWAESIDFYLETRHVCLASFIPSIAKSKYCAKHMYKNVQCQKNFKCCALHT